MKILYVMNVPWGWIKQRPHFIAEQLSATYGVDVIYRKTNTISINNAVDSTRLSGVLRSFRYIPFFRIPFLRYFYSILEVLNKLNFNRCVGDCSKYDMIWISSPILYPLVSNLKQNILYDCMDDMIEISGKNRFVRDLIEKNERNLFKDARVVFSSSKYLSQKLCDRYGYKNNVIVVNNAISSTIMRDDNNISINPNNKLFTITYIGTISEWFDFDLIKSSIERYPNIQYKIYGPSYKELPKIERVSYLGTVSHDFVPQIMAQSDALIMPFVVNELIRSVNPVKLYEYIYSGKPIFAPYYGESSYFEDYVYLYNNNLEFFSMLHQVINGARKTKVEDMRQFVANNTWESRCGQIKKILNEI